MPFIRKGMDVFEPRKMRFICSTILQDWEHLDCLEQQQLLQELHPSEAACYRYERRAPSVAHNYEKHHLARAQCNASRFERNRRR